MPSSSVEPRSGRRSLSLVRFAAGYWRGFAFITASTVLSSAVGLLRPWPMQIAVDHVLSGKPMPEWLLALRRALPGAGSAHGALAWIAIAGLLFFAFESVIDVTL